MREIEFKFPPILESVNWCKVDDCSYHHHCILYKLFIICMEIQMFCSTARITSFLLHRSVWF